LIFRGAEIATLSHREHCYPVLIAQLNHMVGEPEKSRLQILSTSLQARPSHAKANRPCNSSSNL
jgi:hypothetical protein